MERDPRTSAVLCSLSRGGAPSRAALLLRLALAPLLHACFSLVLGTRELSMGFGRDESTAAGSCAQPRPRQRHLAAQAGSAIIQASMERAATQPRSNAPTYAAQWTGQHTTALRRRGNCSAPIAVLLNANKSRAAQRRSPTFGTDGFATCTARHAAGRRGGHNTARRTRDGSVQALERTNGCVLVTQTAAQRSYRLSWADGFATCTLGLALVLRCAPTVRACGCSGEAAAPLRQAIESTWADASDALVEIRSFELAIISSTAVENLPASGSKFILFGCHG
jgi:hypothetical protein